MHYSYRGGLIPSWAKDLKVGSRSFNARADSVATKPLFRNAFRQRRLLVPVSGFYEWQAVPDRKAKQPQWFTRVDEEPVVIAGLWEWWRSPDGEEIYSATIITTDAGPDMEQIHSRQPVILEPETWERWPDPDVDANEELEGMLRPGPAGVLRHWPVGQSVGNVRNQGSELSEAVELGVRPGFGRVHPVPVPYLHGQVTRPQPGRNRTSVPWMRLTNRYVG